MIILFHSQGDFRLIAGDSIRDTYWQERIEEPQQ